MEMDDINTSMSQMEEAFQVLFTQVTYERMALEFEYIHHRKPQPFDPHPIVEALNLHTLCRMHWASVIECALAARFK
jgi:hypothetical protein